MHNILLRTIIFSSFFLFTYPQESTPILLRQGLNLYLNNYFPQTFLQKIKNTLTTLPSLEELEKNSISDNQSVDAFIAQFIAPYLFIEFIDTQWNRETLLNLLNNYVDFENILNFLKKDVEKHWHYSTLFKTYGLKAGDPSIQLIINDIFYTFEKAISAPGKNTQSFDHNNRKNIFDAYKKKLEESNDYILLFIRTNNTIAGWALFSLESEQRVLLEALCIHPDYKKYEINKKLITSVHQKFPTIKSIVTMNKNINVKTSYFCGV